MSGILIGGFYALVASGKTVFIGTIKVINLAYGEQLILGAFTSYWLVKLWGVDPILSMPVAGAVAFITGVAIQHWLITPTKMRVNPRDYRITSCVVTFGISLALQSLFSGLWTSYMKSLTVPYMMQSLDIFGIQLGFGLLLSFGLSLIVTMGFYTFLKRTDFGIAVRATGQSELTATLMGIDTKQVFLVTNGLCSAIAGVSGTLFGILFVFGPFSGPLAMLRAFAIAVLGGVGNLKGALLAALSIGIIESVSMTLLPAIYRDVVIFAIFIIAVLVRSGEIFGD